MRLSIRHLIFTAAVAGFCIRQANAFSESQRIVLPGSGNAYLTAGSVDPGSHVAYAGSLDGQLLRFTISPLTYKDTINIHSLASGTTLGPVNAIALSPDGSTALIWAANTGVKVNTSNMSLAAQKTVLSPCLTAIVDWNGGVAYCPGFGYILKNNVSDLSSAGEWTYPTTESMGSGYTDGTSLFLLAQPAPPAASSPQQLLQIRLSDGQITSNRNLPITDALTYGQDWWDPTSGYAYLAAQTGDGHAEILKVRLSDLTLSARATLSATGPIRSGFIDTSAGYLYTGVGAVLYKVRLADMAPAGQVTFANVTSTDYQVGFRDPSTGMAVVGYNVTASSPQADALQLNLADDAGSGVPPPPLAVSAASSDHAVVVSWNAVPGSTSYDLYWATNPGVTMSNSTRVAGVTSPYTLAGLTGGDTYYLAITAANAQGESVLSQEVHADALSTPLTQPLPPQNLVVTAGESSVLVGWNPSVEATSYNFYWSTAPFLTPSNATQIAGVVSPYTLSALLSGTSYYVAVTAVNSAGESGLSQEMLAVTLGSVGGGAPAGVPGITSLSPLVSAGDPGYTLTVNGSDFVPGDSVLWNGQARATQFVSATQLTATINAADIETAASINISVQTTGGVVSNVMTYTVYALPVITSFSVPNGGFIAPDATLNVQASNAASYAWTISLSGSSNVPVQVTTTSPALALAPLQLALGSYSVTVVGINPAGRVSSSASVSVTLVESAVGSARVYPNPWREDQHASIPVTFDRLPLGSSVKIFSLSGEWIRTLSAPTGSVTWNLLTDGGRDVASGIYLYLVTDSNGNHITDRLVIIR